MKVNNKGMAISGILYSFLVLFLVLLFGTFALLASGKYTFDKLKNDILIKLSSEVVSELSDSSCFQFKYDTATIIGYNFSSPQCGTEVVVPESINYIPVKYIAAGAFYGGDQIDSKKLTSIDLSKMTYLREIYGGATPLTGAFASNKITNVKLGTLLNLVQIGNYVFYSNNITSIDLTGIPNITTIPTGMLYNNSITSINFSNLTKVTTIGDFAFYKNSLSGTLDLSKLTSLISLGVYSFSTNNISSVNTNNLINLKNIYTGAFHNNILETFNFDNLTALDYIGPRAFSYNMLSTVSITKNALLTRIGNSAFQKNQITSIAITAPKLTLLDGGAFQANLINGTIDLSNNPLLTTIGAYAFNFNNINRVIFRGSVLGENAFSFNSFQAVDFNTDMPNITNIGNYAFYHNNNINSISISTIPLTRVGDAAFYDALLTSISFPSTVTNIGPYAFSKNNIAGTLNLSTITGSLTLGKLAFSSNEITSLSLPTMVVSISGGVFNDNQLPADQANIYARNVDGTINSSTIVSYGGAARGVISIPISVTTIGDYAYNSNRISGVTFHSGITKIGTYAFSQSAFTTALDLSSMTNLVTIGNYAFAGAETVSNWYGNSYSEPVTSAVYNNVNYQYKSVSSGQGVSSNGFESASSSSIVSVNFTGLSQLETIGNFAFYGIKASSLIGFGDLIGLKTISESAFRSSGVTGALDFSKMVNLTTIAINAFSYLNISGTVDLSKTKITAIENNLFLTSTGKITRVNSLLLPEGLLSIGTNAFDYFCIESLTLPSTLKTIGNYAFRGNYLTTLSIPNNVTTIGIFGFYGNKIVGNLDLSNTGITTVSASAFENNLINTLNIGNTIKNINNSAFRANHLTSLTIPSTVTTIETFAFYGNTIAGTLDLSSSNITNVAISAFENNQITNLVIGNNIKTINENAFKGNYINQLTLGNGVTEILDNAFQNNRLSYVIIPTNVTSIGVNAFSQTASYPWLGVTINSNSNVKVNRFTLIWTNIGWPIEFAPTLMVEEITVSTTVENLFVYYGTYYEATIETSGYYQLQAWGAQGGNSLNSKVGGKGAYASGNIYLETGTKLYIYVGGAGSYSITAGYTLNSFNGGGKGYTTGSAYTAGSGGGATDFRLVSGDWDDESSLASRILVSAGGGGATFSENGSAGGSLKGYSVTGGSTAGTQISGGIAAELTKKGTNGGFGYGGNGAIDSSAGGGGGYYGGAGGSQATSNNKGAPGGSSYISGYLNCVAIKSASDYEPVNTDLTSLLLEDSYHYSGLLFIDPVLIGGQASNMPSVIVGVETGHSGSGYAKITYIGPIPPQ